MLTVATLRMLELSAFQPTPPGDEPSPLLSTSFNASPPVPQSHVTKAPFLAHPPLPQPPASQPEGAQAEPEAAEQPPEDNAANYAVEYRKLPIEVGDPAGMADVLHHWTHQTQPPHDDPVLGETAIASVMVDDGNGGWTLRELVQRVELPDLPSRVPCDSTTYRGLPPAHPQVSHRTRRVTSSKWGCRKQQPVEGQAVPGHSQQGACAPAARAPPGGDVELGGVRTLASSACVSDESLHSGSRGVRCLHTSLCPDARLVEWVDERGL